jgi:glutamine amidotransferase
MQLLFQSSEEGGGDGATGCLGIIAATVRRMSGTRERPIPHMGWNQLQFATAALLFTGLMDGVHMYFVHGYAAPVGPWTQATTVYGEPFTAVVAQRNFFGTQFHPERSARNGSRLLANFLQLDPCV